MLTPKHLVKKYSKDGYLSLAFCVLMMICHSIECRWAAGLSSGGYVHPHDMCCFPQMRLCGNGPFVRRAARQASGGEGRRTRNEGKAIIHPVGLRGISGAHAFARAMSRDCARYVCFVFLLPTVSQFCEAAVVELRPL